MFEQIFEQIVANPAWFWLSLGGVLLAAEMLGLGGYVLWSGIAAVIVSMVRGLLPLSWPWQGLLFALLTVVAALLWWHWVNRYRAVLSSFINQRVQQLIGQRAVLTEATKNGYSRIKIADGSWRIQSDSALPAGTEVEVVAVDGITLKVRPLITRVSQRANRDEPVMI